MWNLNTLFDLNEGTLVGGKPDYLSIYDIATMKEANLRFGLGLYHAKKLTPWTVLCDLKASEPYFSIVDIDCGQPVRRVTVPKQFMRPSSVILNGNSFCLFERKDACIVDARVARVAAKLSPLPELFMSMESNTQRRLDDNTVVYAA